MTSYSHWILVFSYHAQWTCLIFSLPCVVTLGVVDSDLDVSDPTLVTLDSLRGATDDAWEDRLLVVPPKGLPVAILSSTLWRDIRVVDRSSLLSLSRLSVSSLAYRAPFSTDPSLASGVYLSTAARSDSFSGLLSVVRFAFGPIPCDCEPLLLFGLFFLLDFSMFCEPFTWCNRNSSYPTK